MAITKVPNGPLIKKKGPFKGSTLKTGGRIKKAINGTTTTQTTTPVKKPTWQEMTQAQRAAIKTELGPERFKTYKDSVSTDATNRREAILNRNAAARGLTREQVRAQQEKDKKKPDAVSCDLADPNFSSTKCGISKAAAKESKADFKKKKNGGTMKKAKAGAMIKRADGSMSKRGLWDNIRANKGSGKKPTKQMLVQEKKIKAKSKK